MNNKREFYASRILDMIMVITNEAWLEKIYWFVKVFADDGKGGVSND